MSRIGQRCTLDQRGPRHRTHGEEVLFLLLPLPLQHTTTSPTAPAINTVMVVATTQYHHHQRINTVPHPLPATTIAIQNKSRRIGEWLQLRLKFGQGMAIGYKTINLLQVLYDFPDLKYKHLHLQYPDKKRDECSESGFDKFENQKRVSMSKTCIWPSSIILQPFWRFFALDQMPYRSKGRDLRISCGSGGLDHERNLLNPFGSPILAQRGSHCEIAWFIWYLRCFQFPAWMGHRLIALT